MNVGIINGGSAINSIIPNIRITVSGIETSIILVIAITSVITEITIRLIPHSRNILLFFIVLPLSAFLSLLRYERINNQLLTAFTVNFLDKVYDEV